VEDLPEKILKKFDKNILYKFSEEIKNEKKDYDLNHFPTLEEIEKEHIMRTLILTNGKIQESAELLGIHRNTLRLKIEKYQLKKYFKEIQK
jgi:transcriptional regulator of acetoin/glycerol metabolism